MTSNLPDTFSAQEQQYLAYGLVAEEVEAAMAAGREPDTEALARQHPKLARQICQLVATLMALNELGHAPHGQPEIARSGHPIGLLGDYRILREIGRGGMGVVYEAEQISLGRTVALKVLPFAAILGEKQLARFKNEARAAASLDHPHIVSVFSVGCERAVHFYAMQYVEGRSLAEILAQQRVEDDLSSSQADNSADTEPIAALSTQKTENPAEYFRRVARLGIQAAEALQHAHDRGIVHRDIKPSNLMVDTTGKLLITDFGLAQIEGTGDLTMTGDILGTLRYMSPEQASGEKILDQRTDIYSLGVTLCEMITGQPAISGDNRQEILRKVIDQDPPRPRQFNAEIPVDLETIILKAIEKEPNFRYKSASALASDLQRFLDNQPIHARRLSFFQRSSKWSYRHRAILSAVAITLLVTLSFATFYLAKAYQNEAAERRHAQENLEMAREAVDEMYVDLAQEWITTETGVSSVQKHFLQRAVSFYDRLSKDPSTGAEARQKKAIAYRRAGEIRFYLRQPYLAKEALNQAVYFYQGLLEQQPNSLDLHSDLAEAYHSQGRVFQELLFFEQAEEAYDLGRKQTEKNISAAKDPQERERLIGRLELRRAELLLRTDRLVQAEPELRRLYQQWKQRSQKNRADLYPKLMRFESAALLVQLLRFTDRLAEAEQLAKQESSRCQYEKMSTWHDSRSIAELEVSLSRQLAEVLLADDRLVEAKQRLEKTLQLKAASFKAGLDPISFMIASTIRKKINADENSEYYGFCEYAEIQLRLAKVLEKLGQNYEAELLLGDAVRTLQIICDINPRELKYRVAWANGWLQAAQLLVGSRPGEAKIALEMATALCRANLRKFPRLERYNSGLHGRQNDLDHFLSLHPDVDLSVAGPEEAMVRKKLFNLHFHSHTLAVAWFRLGKNWQEAIKNFTKSAELRTHSQSFDCFYLAMAHCHLKEYDKAQQWLAKAVRQMQEMKSPDPALQRLYDEAQQLLQQADALPEDSSVGHAPHDTIGLVPGDGI